jgi:hypothetical protein
MVEPSVVVSQCWWRNHVTLGGRADCPGTTAAVHGYT